MTKLLVERQHYKPSDHTDMASDVFQAQELESIDRLPISKEQPI
jgi:hypothetical protein